MTSSSNRWVSGHDASVPTVENVEAGLLGATADLLYSPAGFSANGWTPKSGAGNVLFEAGSGSSPAVADAKIFGSNGRAVSFPGAKRLEDTGTALGDPATNDFVVGWVGKLPSINKAVVNKRGASGDGWALDFDGSQRLSFYVDGASGTATIVTAALELDQWYAAMLFYNSAGSAQWYVDGVGSGSAVAVSGVGSISRAVPFTIGDKSNGSAAQFDGEIALFGMWIDSALLSTHLNPAVANNFANTVGLR